MRSISLVLALIGSLGGVATASRGEGATRSRDFATFAGGKFRLGLSPNELVTLGVRCHDEEEPSACAPERFAPELAPEEDTKIRAFSLMLREVSVGEFRRCEVLGHCSQRTNEDEDPELPVTLVEYRDALDFCAFVGARLPSEAEFEFATRGKSRRIFAPRIFSRKFVNAGQPGPLATDGRDGFVGRAPVRSFAVGATPEGVLHLSGNVEEWTSSKGTATYEGVPEEGLRIVRGGHFASPVMDLRGTFRRMAPEREKTKTRGFRCAR